MSYFDDYIATGVNCSACHDHIGMDVGHVRTCTACTPAEALAKVAAKTPTQKRNARKRKALKNLRIAKALARANEARIQNLEAERDRLEQGISALSATTASTAWMTDAEQAALAQAQGGAQ